LAEVWRIHDDRKKPLTPTLSPPIFAAGRGDLEWRTQNDKKNDLLERFLRFLRVRHASATQLGGWRTILPMFL